MNSLIKNRKGGVVMWMVMIIVLLVGVAVFLLFNSAFKTKEACLVGTSNFITAERNELVEDAYIYLFEKPTAARFTEHCGGISEAAKLEALDDFDESFKLTSSDIDRHLDFCKDIYPTNFVTETALQSGTLDGKSTTMYIYIEGFKQGFEKICLTT